MPAADTFQTKHGVVFRWRFSVNREVRCSHSPREGVPRTPILRSRPLRPVLQQKLRDGPVVLGSSEVQRGDAGLCFRLRVGPCVACIGGVRACVGVFRGYVGGGRGFVERSRGCILGFKSRIWGGRGCVGFTVLEEQLNDSLVATKGGEVKRRVPVVVGVRHVRPCAWFIGGFRGRAGFTEGFRGCVGEGGLKGV